jgi:hypothetical protein
MARSSPLDQVRRICLALTDANERESRGAPTFFIRDKRSFVSYMDDHHDDGRLAHLGWIGVRLDRDLVWNEIAGLIKAAHGAVMARLSGSRRSATKASRST